MYTVIQGIHSGRVFLVYLLIVLQFFLRGGLLPQIVFQPFLRGGLYTAIVLQPFLRGGLQQFSRVKVKVSQSSARLPAYFLPIVTVTSGHVLPYQYIYISIYMSVKHAE